MRAIDARKKGRMKAKRRLSRKIQRDVVDEERWSEFFSTLGQNRPPRVISFFMPGVSMTAGVKSESMQVDQAALEKRQRKDERKASKRAAKELSKNAIEVDDAEVSAPKKKKRKVSFNFKFGCRIGGRIC